MSRSNVGYEDPWAPPATPPITTKSIPASASRSRRGSGSNRSAAEATLKLAYAIRPLGLPPHSVAHRLGEVLFEQRDVVAVVDRPGFESELLTKEVEQVGEGVDRRGNQVALDPRDRGLRRAGPVGELLLRQAVPATSLAKKLSRCHEPRISDLMYEGSR